MISKIVATVVLTTLVISVQAADFGSLLKGVEKLKGQSASGSQPVVQNPTANSVNKSPGASVLTASANNVELPRLHFDYPDIAWRVGDSVQVFEKEKWHVGTVTNLDFDKRPLTVRIELYPDLNWWPWKDIKPMDGYAYAKFPAATAVGTEEDWKVGDRVEMQYFWGNKFHWKPGVVVSVDGDNYYVYAPGDTVKYFWRHKSRIRNTGSAKEGWLADQADPSGLVSKYQAELSGRGCSFGANHFSWAFLWNYDHSFSAEDILYRMTADDLKKVIEGYACYAKARQNFPDLPVTGGAGEKIQGRFDVQAQMIARHKEIIRTAVTQFVQNMAKPVTLSEVKISGDWVPPSLAQKNGFEALKSQVTKSLEKYKSIAEVVGASASPNWDDVRKLYDAEVEALNARATAAEPSLKSIAGYTKSFSARHPTIEKLASSYALGVFPGGKVLHTGMTSSDLEVIKHSSGIPQYRYVYAAVLMRHPDYRHCFKYAVRYKEEYSGGGKFSSGQIDRGTGGRSSLAIDEFTRCQ